MFPSTIHPIDIFHATEYLWNAGDFLYKEASEEPTEWVEEQKDLAYEGCAAEVVKDNEN